MRSSTKCNIWAVFLTALMLTSLIQQPTEMSEESIPLEAGRQSSIEAACEGLTFEDMFNYSHATFDIQMNDDWESAYVQAVAWINGTLSDQVRLDLEGLFAGTGLPGGGNGWLSSDEYQMIDSVAAECVTQTNPRIGFRGGGPHRGGDGVNWYNATWENTDETPLTVEEWNLMPMNHIDERTCEQSSPNSDCVEIPNIPLSPGRNCDTTINDPDECRIIVWLNGTFVFEGMTLGGLSNDNFTMAMNTSNMTNADLSVIYPALEGLRLGTFEECDGRSIDAEHNDNQGDAPVPGTCTSDETISYETRLVSIDEETRLRVDTHVEYDVSNWPIGQDMFFDMTTVPPEIDNPPTWTMAAPADENIMPIADDGVVHFLSTAQMAAWATDDQGAPLISCTGAEGWSMTSDADGLSADAPDSLDSTSVTCMATDSAGQSTDERNYTLQVPMRVSGTVSGDLATVTMTPTSGMPTMDAVVTLVQDDSQTISDSVSVDIEAAVVTVDLASMSPGPFTVRINADGTGMANFAHTYNLEMAKASAAPSLTIVNHMWIGENYEITGQFSDPDGDPVTITATNNEMEWGTIGLFSGNQWMANGAGIPGSETNSIILTACDSWNQCSTLPHEAGATPDDGDDDADTPPPVSESSGDDGLAVAGFIIAIVALVIVIIAVVAMVLLGRRK